MSEIYSSAGNERSENAYCKQNESTLEEFRGRRSRRVLKKRSRTVFFFLLQNFVF